MTDEIDRLSAHELADTSEDLPSVRQDGEMAVCVQSEGLLVVGDPAEIDTYIERIRSLAGNTVDVIDADKASVGNAAGLAAGAAAFLGQSAKFVQLHPDSVKAIRKGQLIPGSDGFYRMMTRGADKKFVSQLQWKQANLNPTRMMSLQMVAVQLALKTAIAEVEQSVQRVEGKVEEVLRLAHANRSGDVLGDRVTIDRMVTYLEKNGSFSDADWDAIAAIGPSLNRTVEQLRHHADRTLKSFDPTKPIQDRAEFIVRAVEGNQLGETLGLLVVAQESLFKWQRLRLARVEATQPEHLQQVLDDARDLLARQLAEDGSLFQRAREILDAVAKTEALDGFRFWSVQGLERALPLLRADLDRFAGARRAQSVEWQEFKAPSPREAASAAIDMASETATAAWNVAGDTASLALGAASEGIDRLGGFFGRARSRTQVLRRDKDSHGDCDERSAGDSPTDSRS